MNEQTERGIVELIAWDRIDIPISSLSGKLKRGKPKIAVALGLTGKVEGERAYARVEVSNEQKARGMAEGIDKFCNKYPTEGKILQGYIAEQRKVSEKHLYFGMNEGKRLTEDDYTGVLQKLGFSEGMAKNMYPILIEASRKIAKARDEERSVMIGSEAL